MNCQIPRVSRPPLPVPQVCTADEDCPDYATRLCPSGNHRCAGLADEDAGTTRPECVCAGG